MTSIVIGRAPSCDIVVDDEYVTPRHCEIFSGGSDPRWPGAWYVRDLGSTNGTRIIRGQPNLLSAPGFSPSGRHMLALTRGLKVDVIGMRLILGDVVYVGRTAVPCWDRT